MRNGVRMKSDDEIGPGVFGEIRLAFLDGKACLSVFAVGDGGGSNARLIPSLWYAQCANFQGNMQRWTGYSRGANGKPEPQEWMITFVSEHPPASATVKWQGQKWGGC